MEHLQWQLITIVKNHSVFLFPLWLFVRQQQPQQHRTTKNTKKTTLKPAKPTTSHTSSSKYANQFMCTAADFRCWAPRNWHTYSIQNMASCIGGIGLVLKIFDTSLALFKYVGFVSSSCTPFKSVSLLILKYGNTLPYPLRTARIAFRCWSPKNGMRSIGTPCHTDSTDPKTPPCEMNNTVFGWAKMSFCGNHLRIITFDGKSGSVSSSNFQITRCFRRLKPSTEQEENKHKIWSLVRINGFENDNKKEL